MAQLVLTNCYITETWGNQVAVRWQANGAPSPTVTTIDGGKRSAVPINGSIIQISDTGTLQRYGVQQPPPPLPNFAGINETELWVSGGMPSPTTMTLRNAVGGGNPTATFVQVPRTLDDEDEAGTGAGEGYGA